MDTRYTARSPLRYLLLISVIVAGFGVPFAARAAHNVSFTKIVGAYTINLKLLPAERFTRRSLAHTPSHFGQMVYGGGAAPVRWGSSERPNHHLVVFVRKDGKREEHAAVRISYRKLGQSDSKAMKLPVTRMWIAGKGPKTTHYGNNVRLSPGRYLVQVLVNHFVRANFRIRAN